ncbi:hypothetical protein CEXT_545361 [Caerostris extrusa]|uniref:Uncharacterized protein n=1 Tax=Caerostris extrusa TaxID=172846 RepID=A0AAV4S820_CAEEX|nr:hypothetical protein CEXT_545361 [Caerostris extrusa]
MQLKTNLFVEKDSLCIGQTFQQMAGHALERDGRGRLQGPRRHVCRSNRPLDLRARINDFKNRDYCEIPKFITRLTVVSPTQEDNSTGHSFGVNSNQIYTQWNFYHEGRSILDVPHLDIFGVLYYIVSSSEKAYIQDLSHYQLNLCLQN